MYSGPPSRPTGGGDAGDGGDGRGGHGGAFHFYLSTPTAASHLTACLSQVGQGVAGGAGTPGTGTYPGAPGISGYAYAGDGIFSYQTSNSFISNGIIWGNQGRAIAVTSCNAQVNYSCIQGGYPGTGNINVNPLFTSGPDGGYYLSQVAAGQAQQSPCVDAGCPDSSLFIGTTRTDNVLDSAIVDMGYHYAALTSQPMLHVSPFSLQFQAAFGGGCFPLHQDLLIFNIGTGSFSYQIEVTANWLSVLPGTGGPVIPGNGDTLQVEVDHSGMGLGTYQGSIIITAPEALGSPDTINVNLVIGNADLQVEPNQLYFVAGHGGCNPPPQSFTIGNAGAGTLFFTATENADWLSVTPMSGGPVPPAAVCSVQVDITGLVLGVYTSSIVVTSPFAANSPDTLWIVLDIVSPLMAVAPDTLSFLASLGVPSPPETFQVWNPGLGAFTFSIVDSLDWVTATPDSGGPVPPEVSISVTVTGPSLGWHYGDIWVVPDNPYLAPQPVHIAAFIVNNAMYGPVSGVLSGDCEVFDHAWVPQGEQLILEPGTTVRFLGPYRFTVYGQLRAQGTEDDSIRFIPLGDSISWRGLRFSGSGASESRMDYCIVSGSDSSGIRCLSASPIVRYCTIANNKGPFCSGILSLYGGPEFHRCTILDNFPVQDNSGWFNCYSDSTFFSHCTFSSNLNGTAYLAQSEAKITNCIFAPALPGTMIIGFGSVPILRFNDFYGTTATFLGYPLPGFGSPSYTNLNGDSCDAYGNIFLDPLFVDPASGDFHLQWGSPCIDAGDPTFPYDPDSTIADMGAFYYDQPLGVDEPSPAVIPTAYALHPCHPNPFNPTTTLRFDLPAAGWVRLEVFDTAGRRVYGARHASPLPSGEAWYPAGTHEVTFDGTALPSGIYFVRLAAGEGTQVQKVVLLK
ncbi:MAG: T9SS C-terminal target domain-containing protein [Candidatus Zixiibacteriota bacterium]|nr:MAG: T9SS C-terminal target domain-containing protein [candidate division Zixibacteria bacterium]